MAIIDGGGGEKWAAMENVTGFFVYVHGGGGRG
jgi:hypothetical protein